MLAAYIHVPFCARVCPYCDFAVVAGRDDLVGRYFDALLAEIDMEPPAGPLGSVFIGGGTPSRVSPGLVAAVIDRLSRRFGLADAAEVSLEANPEDWDIATAGALAGAGVTRVSLGVQSLDDRVLGELGRLHTGAEARTVVATARAAGFRSVSVDLIFGSPVESIESWRETVAGAIALGPDHVSTYALTVEGGTLLSRQVAAGAPGPDPDDQADKYLLARRLLEDAGLRHYEVSNYARAGHECAYNCNTWRQGDYLAFGVGAHGHRGGIRRRNVRRLEAYLEMVEGGARPEAGRETVGKWDSELERVFLGVRLRAGVPAGAAGPRLAVHPEAERLIAAGKLEVTDARIRVMDPLFTDAVARVVLALEPPAA